ncbi:MAG: metallophosphoesterase [Thermoplasmata archaeon]
MTSDKIEPVHDKPALMAGDSLVIADLHIGKEEELRQAGVTLPSQARRMGDEVVALVKECRPRRLIILGDLKHQFPRSTGLERREVPRFFDQLEGLVPEVHLVQGNHDGNISHILPRWVTLHGAGGFRIDDIGLVHGHAWSSSEIMEADSLLMGHNHPTIMFPDRLGFRSIHRCWIRGAFTGTSQRYSSLPQELIILPAFNEFSGGTIMNETGSRLLGPILNSGSVRMEEAKVYLLDGLYLGKLRDMMVEGKGGGLE